MIRLIVAFLLFTTLINASEFLGPTMRSELSGDACHLRVDSSLKHHRFLKAYTFFFPPEYTSGVKLQSELLLQKIVYPFSSSVWIPQLSWGTSFKKILDQYFLDSYELDFFASYSWGKLLNNERLYFLPFSGCGVQGGIEKRVPFFYTTFGAWFIYEEGNHHSETSKDKAFSGPGYSIGMKHDLPKGFVFSEKVTLRVPFNYYEVSLKWSPIEDYSIGIFGDLHRKNLKPKETKYNMGIQWDIRIPVKTRPFWAMNKNPKNVPERIRLWRNSSEPWYPYVQHYTELKEKTEEKPINIEISFEAELKEE